MFLVATEVMLLSQLQHFFEVAIFPSIGVATGHNPGAGFFDLGLAERGLAQLLFLLRVLDDYKTPGLQVVPAGSFQPSPNDLLQISIGDCYIFEIVCGAPFLDRRAQRFLTSHFYLLLAIYNENV